MAICSPWAEAEAVGEVFVGPCTRIGRHHTCPTIHQLIQHFTGVDIIRRLLRAMVAFRQVHRICFDIS